MNFIIADDILTEALVKIKENRIGNSVDQDMANYLFNTMARLYIENKWIKAPVRKTPSGPSYQTLYLKEEHFEGYYLILYSDIKYHRKKFGEGIGMLSMKDYLEMYINCYSENKCSGIIINPESSEETILANDCIEYIFKQIFNLVNIKKRRKDLFSLKRRLQK